MMNTILFVCTGNTCRSPMAACMMERILQTVGLTGWKADSAGVAAWDGQPASAGAQNAMAAQGLSLAGHRSKGVTETLLHQAQLVVCVGPSHAAALTARFAHLPPVRCFDPAIPDPFGGTDAEYRACAAAMQPQLEAIAAGFAPMV